MTSAHKRKLCLKILRRIIKHQYSLKDSNNKKDKTPRFTPLYSIKFPTWDLFIKILRDLGSSPAYKSSFIM